MPKLRAPSYLHVSRHGVYGFRIVFPRDVRDRFPRVEMRVSLRTRDPQDARRLSAILAYRASGYMGRIRTVNFDEGVALGQELIELLQAEAPEDKLRVLHQATALNGDEQLVALATRYSALSTEILELQAQVTDRAEQLVRELQGMDERRVDGASADAMADMNELRGRQQALREEVSHVVLDIQTRAQDLAHSRREAELVASFDNERTQIQRTAVDMMAMVMERGVQAPGTPQAPTSGAGEASPPTKTVSQVLDAFVADKAGSKKPLKEESVDGYRNAVGLFIECMGDSPLAAVDRECGRKFVEILKALPKSRNTRSTGI